MAVGSPLEINRQKLAHHKLPEPSNCSLHELPVGGLVVAESSPLEINHQELAQPSYSSLHELPSGGHVLAVPGSSLEINHQEMALSNCCWLIRVAGVGVGVAMCSLLDITDQELADWNCDPPAMDL